MCNQLGRIDNFDKFFPFLLVLEYLQALKSSNWNLLLCIFKKLREEQAARLVFEKAQREEMERRWQSLKAYIDEEAQLSRQAQQVTASSFKVLNLGTVFSSYTKSKLFTLLYRNIIEREGENLVLFKLNMNILSVKGNEEDVLI